MYADKYTEPSAKSAQPVSVKRDFLFAGFQNRVPGPLCDDRVKQELLFAGFQNPEQIFPCPPHGSDRKFFVGGVNARYIRTDGNRIKVTVVHLPRKQSALKPGMNSLDLRFFTVLLFEDFNIGIPEGGIRTVFLARIFAAVFNFSSEDSRTH